MRINTIFSTLTAIALVLAGPRPAFSADLRRVVSDYNVTSWDRKDGLPPGRISALAQDADGFLWLGGDFGLVRFDGARFVQWNDARSKGLPQGPVQALHAAKDGSLWIGFRGQGGISRIRRDGVDHFGNANGLMPGPVAIIVDNRATGGLLAVCGGLLFHFDGGRWQRWPPDYGQDAGVRVRTAYTSASGDLFLVSSAGTFRKRLGADALELLERNRGEFLAQDVVVDRLGRPWVTDVTNGVRQLGESPIRARPRPSRSGRGFRLLTDRSGDLWVATVGQGLWRVHTDGPPEDMGLERATHQTGLSDNAPSALLEDRDGNIWVGASDGLSRLTPHKITEFTTPGLATGLGVSPDGHIWVGTTDGVGRLSEHDGALSQEAWYLRGSRTRAMRVDRGGTVWVATDGGLYRITQDGTLHTSMTDLRRIVAITSGLRGDIWLYDLSRGLVRWNGRSVETVSLPPDLQNVRISTMHTDRSGRIWLGFVPGQVAIVQPDGTMTAYRTGDAQPAAIQTIYQDHGGTIWIVSSLGLRRFSEDRFVVVPKDGGIPTNLTGGIIADRTGALWVGIASGIVRLTSPDAECPGARCGEVGHHTYNPSEGVAGTAGWIGQHSAVRTRSGRLLFLTLQGLMVFDPRVLLAGHVPEPVRVDDVLANDRSVEPTSRQPFPAATTRLEINYTVPDLTSSLQTHFRYRLVGLDAGWVEAGSRRQALYTNLRGGSYSFEVQADDADGVWTRPAAVWAFAIRPRFYNTRAFYALSALSLLLLAYVVWQRRLTHVRRQFALLLGERVRLSREIHDTLLQSLVGVTLQLDHLDNSLALPPTKRQQLIRVRKQVEEYIREARRSIWDLRSSTLQRHDLATALGHAGDRAAARDIAFELRVTGAPYRCGHAVEEQVLRIGHEAVNNAIQHAQAKRIEMELHYDEAAVTLRVSDDGHGFEPPAINGGADGHYGVTSMKERAELLHGALHISSVVGSGTVVEARVPTADSARARA